MKVNIGNSFISSINTIVKNQKQSFDRTIQAIVQDNSDKEKIGEIKILYKDAVLSVYTDVKEVKNYLKGSHIYVTIPNNDMSARKTILGLVEKIGPLVVMDDIDNYSLESQYDTKNSIVFEDNDFSQELTTRQGWSYQRNLNNEWIVTDINDETISIGNNNIINFLQILKDFSLQSDTVRLKCLVTTFLAPEQINLLKADYGIGIDFYFQPSKEELPLFNTEEQALNSLAPIKNRLNIDQLSGDPFMQQNQKQYLIIDTSRVVTENNLKKINFYFYKKGFPFVSNFLSNIKINNFVLEAVTQIQRLETTDLTLYITTPNGKMFLNENDSVLKGNGAVSNILTLNAVLKEDGVQLDNTSLKCWWYEKDTQYIDYQTSLSWKDSYKDLPADAVAAYDAAGAGWRLVSVDEDLIPYTANPFSVTKQDFYGILDKEYKVVAIYNGTLLSATVQLKNLENKNVYSLQTTFNQTSTVYSLAKDKSDSAIERDIRWYYIPDGDMSRLLRTSDGMEEGWKGKVSSESPWQITIEKGAFRRSGQIICEIYRSVRQVKKLYSTVTAVYNADTDDSVVFHNFEQVFLYDNYGNISLIDEVDEENKYSVFMRPVGITGNVTDIVWRIPKDYFERPEKIDKEEDIENQGFYQIHNVLSLSKLRIKTKYPDYKEKSHCPKHENIVVDFTYNNKRYRKTTHFSFVKEGMDGTNGSGIFCKIVPNVDMDISLEDSNPNNVLFYIKPNKKDNILYPQTTLFNFLPTGFPSNSSSDISRMMQNNEASHINYFKVQLWKKNQKIFDGVKNQNSNEQIKNLKWSLFEATQEYYSINQNTNIKINNRYIPTDDDKSYKTFKTWLNKPQGISIQLQYQNLEFKYSLPFLTLGECASTIKYGDFYESKFNELKHSYLFNEYDSFSLTSYSKFYYNEDGIFDNSLGQQNNDNGFAHYFLPFQIYQVTCQLSNDMNIIKPVLVKKQNNFTYLSQDDLALQFSIVNEIVYAKKNYLDYNNNIICYKSSNGSSVIFCQIPLLTHFNLIKDNVITDWDGITTQINDEKGTITATSMVAGVKNINNTFSGAILGSYKDKNGLILYSDGAKAMYLNSEGKIELGINPAKKILINNQDRIIDNGLVNGLSIDLNNGKLNYQYSNAAISAKEESDLDKDKIKKAIEIVKKNKTVFSLSENGILQSQEIVGETNSNRNPWGVYENITDIKQIDNLKTYFIQQNGRAGLKELYIDTDVEGGSTKTYLSGLVLRKTGLSYNIKGFCNSAQDFTNTLGENNGINGFSLSDSGFCLGKGNSSNYVGIKPTGEMCLSNGVKIAKDFNSSNCWIFNQSGITNPNKTILLNNDSATLTKCNLGNVVINGELKIDDSKTIREEIIEVMTRNGRILNLHFKQGTLINITQGNLDIDTTTVVKGQDDDDIKLVRINGVYTNWEY